MSKLCEVQHWWIVSWARWPPHLDVKGTGGEHLHGVGAPIRPRFPTAARASESTMAPRHHAPALSIPLPRPVLRSGMCGLTSPLWPERVRAPWHRTPARILRCCLHATTSRAAARLLRWHTASSITPKPYPPTLLVVSAALATSGHRWIASWRRRRVIGERKRQQENGSEGSRSISRSESVSNLIVY
jgi:hypothetical protein